MSAATYLASPATAREAVIEECARVCDNWRRTYTLNHCCDNAQHEALTNVAAAIRALGRPLPPAPGQEKP